MHWHGILRPVVPLLAVPVSFITSYANAIAAVNTAFILLGTLFTYLFAKKLLGAEVGFVSAIGFASAAPVLGYGTAVLTDGAGYAMLIVLFYLSVFVLPEKNSLRTASAVGVLAAIGMLTKETTSVVLIFLILFFFANRGRLNLRHLFVVVVLGFAIPLAWSQVVGHSYLGFYGEGLAYAGSGYNGPLLHPRLFAISAFLAFTLLLPFAFMAFFTLKDAAAFKVICLILFSTGLLVLAWPTLPESRFTFLTFPAVIPLAGLGVVQAAESLAERPWFRTLSKRQWLLVMLLVIVISTNVSKGYFRLP